MTENPYQPPTPDFIDEVGKMALPLSAYVYSALTFLTIFLLVGMAVNFLVLGLGRSLEPMMSNAASISGFVVAAGIGAIVAWRTWRRCARAHKSRVIFELNRKALEDKYGTK